MKVLTFNSATRFQVGKFYEHKMGKKIAITGYEEPRDGDCGVFVATKKDGSTDVYCDKDGAWWFDWAEISETDFSDPEIGWYHGWGFSFSFLKEKEE